MRMFRDTLPRGHLDLDYLSRRGHDSIFSRAHLGYQTSPCLQSQVRESLVSSSGVRGVLMMRIPPSSSAVRTRPEGEFT
jgi:hypothetical protein